MANGGPLQCRCPVMGHSAPTGWWLEPLERREVFSSSPGWDVVLIDSTLPDRAALVRALEPGGRVILFDGREDSAGDVLARAAGWAQEAGTKIRSLSVLSHASAGRFALGREWVSSATLDQSADEWERLGSVLAPGAAINLFGCNLADALGDGRELIQGIARL